MYFHGRIFLRQDGAVGEMNEECKISWYDGYEFCVEYDASTSQVSGIFKQTNFNAGAYVLIPCMFTSIICLVIVIAFILCVPELQDLIGKALVGLASCLLIMHLSFIVQYLDFCDYETTKIIEKMEDISYFSCGMWFFLLWSHICMNAWYYLPMKQPMDDELKLRIWLSTAVSCIAFFVISSTVVIFTESKPKRFGIDFEILKLYFFSYSTTIINRPAQCDLGSSADARWYLHCLLVGIL
jgi:hypothetical protein